MMAGWLKFFCYTLFTTIVMFVSLSFAEVRIKCWINKQGVQECGDQLPPEFAAQGHKVLDERGFIINEVSRELTREELREKKQRENKAAEIARIQRERERQDRLLMMLFSSVEEIEHARDAAISNLDTPIKVALKNREKINFELSRELKYAAEQELKGQTPSESTMASIESLQQQLQKNNNFIREKLAQETAIMQEYHEKIKRYQEIEAAQIENHKK